MFEGSNRAGDAVPRRRDRLAGAGRAGRAQIAAGVDGLVPCGSTGESATLTHEEHRRCGRWCGRPRGRVPVIAGTGSNSTAEAVALTRRQGGRRRGALLSRPTTTSRRRRASSSTTPRGRETAFRSSSTTSPAARPRTSCRRRWRGSPSSTSRRREGVHRRPAPDRDPHRADARRFQRLSGDDPHAPDPRAGGKGAISITANLPPPEFADFCARSSPATSPARATCTTASCRSSTRHRHRDEPHPGEDCAGHDGPLRWTSSGCR